MATGHKRTVATTLNYFTLPKDGEKPYININSPPAIPGESEPDRKWRNWVSKQYPTQVEDLRGKDAPSLDKEGFQLVEHISNEKDFNFDSSVSKEASAYYQEVEELLKSVTGANRVFIFDHTIRRRRPEVAETGPDSRQPVPSVHVDQTPAAAEARVRRHLPESLVPELLSKRYQIINIWRPIHHAANDWPLALCDFSSVDTKKDLVPTTLIYPDREGETYSVLHNDAHQWKYFKDVKTNEVILIKCFDTILDRSVSSLTPHTAFKDPTTSADAPLRESIELRALVFYP